MKVKDTYLETGQAYWTLSIRDLLEARDAYHTFLIRKPNVVGTAIGKVRFRKEGVNPRAPKTLESSVVQPYSWPCVLVFVYEWLTPEAFGTKGTASSEDYLPSRLYLPSGREVPVCVVRSAWRSRRKEAAVPWTKFPGSVIGGGYPVMTEVQGEDRWATLGGLVTDGRLTYGLTSLHVTGSPGESLYTLRNDNEVEIGVAAARNVDQAPFSKVYETFPGKHTLVNLDVGLVQLTSIDDVSSQVFGLGPVRGLADVNHDTLSLELVGCPVMGHGCVSGIMQGEIIGLFYRYQTVGGYEYVSDYLIGPRQATKGKKALAFSPQNGDSGTLLVVDDPECHEHMKAIALLWGGQYDTTGDREQPYALATNLGTACRALGVELVSDWNSGFDRWFGAYAHVVLPFECTRAIKDKKLRKLMESNRQWFALPFATEVKDTKGLSKLDIVPLSDVPDLVWKRRGGKFQRGKERPNHFADMDQPNPHSKNQTLLDLCRSNPKGNVKPKVWVEFYKQLGAREKGALPFRIAQIFGAMKGAVAKRQTAEFVCAAGILCHYVFDACLPMHVSYMHHGDPDGETTTKGGKKVPIAYDVHAELDNDMVEYHRDEIAKKLPALVDQVAATDIPVALASLKTPRDAAMAGVKLMGNAVDYANPRDIVRSFETMVDLKKRDRLDALWKKYGRGLMRAMAEAVVLTARLWEAAWREGGAKIRTTGPVRGKDLKKLYETKTGFLDSMSLEDLAKTMPW